MLCFSTDLSFYVVLIDLVLCCCLQSLRSDSLRGAVLLDFRFLLGSCYHWFLGFDGFLQGFLIFFFLIGNGPCCGFVFGFAGSGSSFYFVFMSPWFFEWIFVIFWSVFVFYTFFFFFGYFCDLNFCYSHWYSATCANLWALLLLVFMDRRFFLFTFFHSLRLLSFSFSGSKKWIYYSCLNFEVVFWGLWSGAFWIIYAALSLLHVYC